MIAHLTATRQEGNSVHSNWAGDYGPRPSWGEQMWSEPVSRILSRLHGGDHSSATRVAAVVEQPTRKLSTETGDSTASLFGLAPQGVCHAAPARAGRGALLPHRFTLASSRPCGRAIGGLFSVALSVASPRLDVIQPAARGSSDFPPSLTCDPDGDPPVRSTTSITEAGGRWQSRNRAIKFTQLNCCCL